MQHKKQTAKFEIRDLLGIGMTLVVLVIALAYGMEVLGDQKEDMCDYHYNNGGCHECDDASMTSFEASNTTCHNATDGIAAVTNQDAEFNATSQGMTALGKIPNKLPMIVTVVIAAVIIGVLVRYLWVQYK